jgi:hypothetical protein
MPRCSAASKGGSSPCSLARASCAWLRSRRFAALLTRPARRGLLKVSGRRASQEDSTAPPAGRTKGWNKDRRARCRRQSGISRREPHNRVMAGALLCKNCTLVLEAAAPEPIQPKIRPLFDAPQASRTRAKRGQSGTPFVPTPSEGHGAQAESKAPPLGGGSAATRSLLFASEHGEHLPFDAAEHRGALSLEESPRLLVPTPPPAAAPAARARGPAASRAPV